jgi:DNA-binding PadR family transcriptional regulator
MPTRYAVLGLLLERCGYGYQLVQRLKERLGPAWQLNPSSVYAALDLLDAEGLVRPRAADEAEPEPLQRRARRLVYEITESGRCAFHDWISRPSARQEPIRPELHLKVAFARPEDVPAILLSLAQEERLIESVRRELLDRESIGSDRSLPASLVHRGAIHRLDADLSWIVLTRDALQALAADAHAPAAMSPSSSRSSTAEG